MKAYHTRLAVLLSVLRGCRRPIGFDDISARLGMGNHEYAETTIRRDLDFFESVGVIESVDEPRGDGRMVTAWIAKKFEI